VSFGPGKAEQSATSALQGVTGTATGNSANQIAAGTNLLNTGGTNVASGTNFFNTLLNGNQANTTAMLQPNINQIRQANQNSIQGLSTLMPRGGGRSSTLFSAAYAPESQIQNLFGGARTTAAQALPQIGLQQQQNATNLFGTGNQALNTGLQGNQNLFSNAFQQRQYQNQLYGQLGQGILGLATMPLGGAGTTSLLGMIPGIGA
jgi:hypothetical protein